MNCDDVEVALSLDRPNPSVADHLQHCDRCSQSARILRELQVLLSDGDAEALSQLGIEPQRMRRAASPPRPGWFPGRSLVALAAGLAVSIGGATGVIQWLHASPQEETPEVASSATEPSDEHFEVTDEEFLEVGWPEEGDE